jgi:hypothetical protein
MRLLRLLALLSMFATHPVESNMGDIMVTCNVEGITESNKGDCNVIQEGNTLTVWEEISAALMGCAFEGMDLSGDLETFGVGWELYTSINRRNLRQERELRRCTGTCYKPRSSCCRLHSSFCAGKCNRCSCSRRLGGKEVDIENILANRELEYEDRKHDQRRLVGGQEEVVAKCVADLKLLRNSLLLGQNPPNLCMGESSTVAITCNAYLFDVEGIEPSSKSVCEDFAVHADKKVSFNEGTLVIKGGDVGVSSGTFVTEVPTFETWGQVRNDDTGFAARVLAAHGAMLVKPGAQAMLIEMTGLEFKAGTYRSASAINFAAGKVTLNATTLDGQDDPNAKFLFQAGTTLTTAANTYFELVGGARAENVLWVLGTAATLGANSTLEGSILAGTAITFGTKAKQHGCALAQTFVSFPGEGSVILNEE